MEEQVTKEQIEAWKKQHGDVFKIEVEGRIAYLKSPDRKTLSFAGAAGIKDPFKFNEVILKGCWLAGDMELQTNDGLFLAVGSKIVEIIEVKEAILTKL